MRRVLLVIGLAVVAVFGSATTASAHATLLLTDPANGAVLTAAPSVVTLTFNQPVLGIGPVVEVTGPSGVVSSGRPRLIDREVHETVAANAPNGSYTVQWRLTSIDGHVISGTFGYVVGAPSSVAPAPAPSSTSGGSGGGVPPIVWLLIGAGVLVVLTGVVLAARSGPTIEDDESARDLSG